MQARHRVVWTAVAGVVLAAAAPVRAVDVTACGQAVQGTGELVADLDCSATADAAVKLQGRLRLNGFTITGAPTSDVVRCLSGSCRVDGPGTLTGGGDGVRSYRGAKLGGVTIVANTGDGIRTDSAAKVAGCTVSGNGGDGVRSSTSATLSASTVAGNGGDGVRSHGAAKLLSSTITANGGAGVESDAKARAKLSQITANGLDGIRGLAVTLQDAAATGNGVAVECGVTDECADVAADRLPKLAGTSTCGTSRNTEAGGSWGICPND